MALRDSALYRALKNQRELSGWRARGYATPIPWPVKTAVLRRLAIAGATWIETGTYRGDTTRFLSTIADRVISIEPAPKLYQAAIRRFARNKKVRIINDVSEAALPEVLDGLSGDVCFWLDGHYSAGVTFQGETDTPIMKELDLIEAHMAQLGKLAVFVDDVSCFDPSNPAYTSYPPRKYLVDWAERLGLRWHIEQDIFVALRG